MNPTPSKFRSSRAVFIWTVFAIVAALYLMGGAATTRIPFGPPISLFAVARQLSWTDFGIVTAPAFVIPLIVSTALISYYCLSRNRRLRVAAAIIGVACPLLFLPFTFKALVAYLQAIPQAVIWTQEALAGKTDGEFYSEGFLVYTAMGWWMLFCVALIIWEIVTKGWNPSVA